MSLCTLCRCQELNWSQQTAEFSCLRAVRDWGAQRRDARKSQNTEYPKYTDKPGCDRQRLWAPVSRRSGILSFHAFRWNVPPLCSLCATGYMLPTESVSIWYWFQEINYAFFLNGFFKSPGSAACSCKFACPVWSKSKISMLPWHRKQSWGRENSSPP